MTKMTHHQAFTLIELLIVVAIIAILAAIAVPNFLEASTRSKVSRTKADMRTVAVGIESYRVDNNDVPGLGRWAPPEGMDGGFLSVIPPVGAADRTMQLPPLITTPISYLSSFPVDVFNTKSLRAWPQYRDRILGQWTAILSSKNGASFPCLNQPWETWVGRPFNYALFSCGPDLYWDTWNQDGIVYDPTNGTVSSGDVVYYDRVGFDLRPPNN